MSYVALVTGRFDEMTRFYGELLGFPVVEQWERENARGRRFDAGGMRVEIIDQAREKRPLELGDPADRVHIVIEVSDIEEARERIKVDAPPAKGTSWGSRVFRIHDPDGIPITFLQWLEPGAGRG
jgi:catechol 2,3-dioxygenase-like lactoylglutathione lyase family enzyme